MSLKVQRESDPAPPLYPLHFPQDKASLFSSPPTPTTKVVVLSCLLLLLAFGGPGESLPVSQDYLENPQN